MSVLIYAEHLNGSLKKPAFEAATYGAQLAEKMGIEAVGVVIGNIEAGEAENLGQYGVKKVLKIQHDDLATFRDAPYAETLEAAAKSAGAKFVVLPQSYDGRAAAPRLSIKLDAALVSGANTLPDKDGGKLRFKRPAYSGKAVETLTTASDVCVVTVKSNSFPPAENHVDCAVEDFDFSPQPYPLKSVEIKQNTDKIPLTEAEVVVSGGRGLKGPENWGLIEGLAEQLNAALACSKPVSDVEWRPHEEHVGQTGIQIAPNVYIAVGISGAIQHLAGVNQSKTIIVINKDPEAPFFKSADYGVVGDAFEVVPKLTDAIKARRS